jgi:hypothetical protein
MRDTIEMAREAGLLTWLKPPEDVIERFKSFEAFVRADERKIVMNEPLTKEMWQRFEDEIRADEREACAKVCESEAANPSCLWEEPGCWSHAAENCAGSIRARGEIK